MGRRREERDFRSLERERMLAIFKPLDDGEPPARGTRYGARNIFTGPFEPRLDDSLWKSLLSWLWLPALALFLTIVVALPIPPVAGWMLALGFMAAYCALAWIAYRVRRARR